MKSLAPSNELIEAINEKVVSNQRKVIMHSRKLLLFDRDNVWVKREIWDAMMEWICAN